VNARYAKQPVAKLVSDYNITPGMVEYDDEPPGVLSQFSFRRIGSLGPQIVTVKVDQGGDLYVFSKYRKYKWADVIRLLIWEIQERNLISELEGYRGRTLWRLNRDYGLRERDFRVVNESSSDLIKVELRVSVKAENMVIEIDLASGDERPSEGGRQLEWRLVEELIIVGWKIRKEFHG